MGGNRNPGGNNNVNINNNINRNINNGRRPGGAPAARAGYRAGYRDGSRNSYYSHRDDARRDWMRYRTINHLITAGTYVATRPRYSTTVVVSGSSYYYWGGTYYISSGSRYVVVRPPYGAVVYAVPTATTIVYVDTTPYYYYGGSYYVTTSEPAQRPDAPPPATGVDPNTAQANTEPDADDAQASADTGDADELPPMTEAEDPDQNYKVVSPPVGASVPYLPDDAKEQTVNGKKYYVDGETYYQQFMGDGDTIYMVVENPANKSDA